MTTPRCVALQPLTALEVLLLPTSIPVSPAGLRPIAGLTRLVKLRMHIVQMQPDHLRALRPVLSRLRVFDLNNNQLEAAHLRELAAFPELEELRLDAASLQKGGLQHLAPLQQLRKLSLSGSELTDEALLALPPLPNLKKGDLTWEIT